MDKEVRALEREGPSPELLRAYKKAGNTRDFLELRSFLGYWAEVAELNDSPDRTAVFIDMLHAKLRDFFRYECHKTVSGSVFLSPCGFITRAEVAENIFDGKLFKLQPNFRLIHSEIDPTSNWTYIRKVRNWEVILPPLKKGQYRRHFPNMHLINNWEYYLDLDKKQTYTYKIWMSRHDLIFSELGIKIKLPKAALTAGRFFFKREEFFLPSNYDWESKEVTTELQEKAKQKLRESVARFVNVWKERRVNFV